MSGGIDEPHPRRTVKPRERKAAPKLPIIAIDHESVLMPDGEIYPRRVLPAILCYVPTAILAIENHAAMVKGLHDTFKDHPRWQFRATAVPRTLYRPDGSLSHGTRVDTIIALCGWASTKKHPSKWFYPLDPVTFSKCSPNELRPRGNRLEQLRAWAADVREWCLANGLIVRPTSGGLAAQLLRDDRFYAQPRRKVPRATNDHARDYLPGNHYRLYVREREPADATYIDMRNAHHYWAKGLRFPHADKLHARGYFAENEIDAPWTQFGTTRHRQVLEEHGLFRVRLSSPVALPGTFPLPCMESAGVRLAWLYSNELATVTALGGRVESVCAAWTSRVTDPGLNLYAEWALGELASDAPDAPDAHRRKWLKGTLLATYGILAARPRPRGFGFARAKGELRDFPTSAGPLPVYVKETRAIEPGFANVIHRGMIEAETRLQSLALARFLHAAGCEVLSVYADSVFVRASGAIPLLPEPWRVKEHLRRLQFFAPTAFTSIEMTRLPGIPREDIARVQVIERVRSATIGLEKRGHWAPALSKGEVR